MDTYYIEWLGRRFPLSSVKHVLRIAFTCVMGMFLGFSAFLALRECLGIPVFVSIILWLVLVGGNELILHRNGTTTVRTHALFSPKVRKGIAWALVLLGTAYHVAGHPSLWMLALIVAYWVTVLVQRSRTRKTTTN